jgi:phosphoribosylformylglycinamidine synthase PurS subunit
MKAIVHVALKKTVLDPQGRTVSTALNSQGYDAVSDVRQGKYFEIELTPGVDRETAQSQIEKVAAGVLANPVIEDFKVEILD